MIFECWEKENTIEAKHNTSSSMENLLNSTILRKYT